MLPAGTLAPLLALVSGGTSGIGREAVRGLCAAGFQVVLCARSPDKARAVCEEENAAAASRGQSLSVCEFFGPCEVSSQASLVAFAADFRQRYGRCDVLVNCAAASGMDSPQLTPEGVEVTWATNVVSYHLLSLLMLDLLEASAEARPGRGGRIVNVASDYVGHLDPTAPDGGLRERLSEHGHYMATKQANRLLSWALDSSLRSRGSRVVVNTMTPGLCQTQLTVAMEVPGGRSAAEGAAAVIWLATSSEPAATESGWHWRDDTRRRCELRNPAAELAVTKGVEETIRRVAARGLPELSWVAPTAGL